MKNKIEQVTIDTVSFCVDVSLLLDNKNCMLFNSTEMAKSFGKTTAEWLRLPETQAYIDALLNMGLSHIKNYDDVVKTTKGRNGGTWLHNNLGFVFARWLSPLFAVRFDLWVKERLKSGMELRESRLKSKTGFLPMTLAIASSRENPKHYHFSNEMDLLNRIVLGMTAKEFKELHEVESVRDNLSGDQLYQLSELQEINTSLIKLDFDFQQRKERLQQYHNEKGEQILLQANE